MFSSTGIVKSYFDSGPALCARLRNEAKLLEAAAAGTLLPENGRSLSRQPLAALPGISSVPAESSPAASEYENQTAHVLLATARSLFPPTPRSKERNQHVRVYKLRHDAAGRLPIHHRHCPGAVSVGGRGRQQPDGLH